MRLLLLASLVALGAGRGDGVTPTPCTTNADCPEGICGGSLNCGRHCTCGKDADCPSGKRCLPTTDCGLSCR